MIVSETKPIQEVLELVNGLKKVFLVGCGTCATACRVGGVEDLPATAELLEANNLEVTGWFVPNEACMLTKTKIELKAVTHLIEQSDVIISYSCGAGTQTLCSILNNRIIVPGTNTLFLATTQRVGDFVQQCSMCGDCVLGLTGGLCPQTLCAKSLMNGPCSGSLNGKCETYREQDCVWHKIYEKLKQRDQLDAFEARLPMKDFSRFKSQASIKVKPQKINLATGRKDNEK